MHEVAELTLQALLDGEWRDVALLEFPRPELGAAGACNLEYEVDHVAAYAGRDVPLAAVSARFPLGFAPSCMQSWPAFLDDMRPLGAARSWWIRRLGLSAREAHDFRLLREATIAPIGNLRIREAVPPKDDHPVPRFAKQAVIDREHGFVEYASDRGAQIGGATGAGGESPKLLLRLDDSDRVWIDTWQDDAHCPDRHYLVKFARNDRADIDRVILRSEYVYYRALAKLGVETAPVDGMFLAEGSAGPSLWLPRFDVSRHDGREVRFGVESIYSLLGKEPGSFLSHQAVLEALRRFVRTDWRETLLEYLKRDLLNLVFGNSDNHGRNIAVLKSESSVRLAPVFDFAPMKMDREGIVRSTRWAQFERGSVDWPALLRSFGPDEEFLRAGLGALAKRLVDLPELLAALGLPEQTMEFPALDLRGTQRKLREWGLL